MFNKKKTIKSNDDKNTQNELTPLYPRDDIDISKYEKILESTLLDEKCLNIAITGSYGAGKSSLINTYEKDKELHFTRISLAHFSPIESENGIYENNTNEKKENERLLEGKIINQLIHQTDQKNIPLTRFKIKKHPQKKVIFGYCVAIAVFILLLVFCVFNDSVCSYLFYGIGKNPRLLDSVSFRCVVIFLLTFIGVFFLYKIVSSIISLSNVKKLNIKGNEIELFNSSNDSFFDRYLDEILYILVGQKSDVIVFEDIDRFNDNLIFERLREINTLANIKLCDSKENSNRKIRFIYLIKDDMFSSKDRTKFFDVIIPVIPYINGTNSYDVFLEKFQSILGVDKSKEGIEKDFLIGASIYVDEMRLLLNICNEFRVYDNVINWGHLNKTKLLSLIIYKNLFPKDFDDLQLGKGFLYEIFQIKDSIIQPLENNIRDKIGYLNDRIQSASDELIEDEKELKLVYAGKIFLDSTYIRSHGYISIYDNVWDYLSSDEKEKFEERKKIIKDKALLVSGQLKKEKDILEKELKDIKSLHISEIIKKLYGSMQSFLNAMSEELGWNTKYENIQESVYFGYIKFAIGNGYIDENYAEYFQVFRENSIRYEDKNFLMSVYENNKQSFDYKLNDATLVLDRIGEAYFSNETVLNYDLTCALFKSSSEGKKERLITQLKENNNYVFISEIWNYMEKKEELVVDIAKWWPSFFAEVLSFGAKYLTLIREFSYVALSILNEELLMGINENGCFSSYISNSSDYLGGITNNFEATIKKLILLQVRFVSIDKSYCTNDLLDGVYENSLYEINYGNIRLFLNRYYTVSDEREIKHMNYSVIKKNVDSPIYCYVSDNFDKYLTSYIEFCDKKILDEESIALEIINDENLDEEIRKQYISNYKGLISDIEDIDDSMHKESIVYRIVPCSIHNIVFYVRNNSFDNVITDFINREEVLYDESSDKEFLFSKVLPINGLKFEKYKELILHTGNFNNNSVPLNLDEDKIRFLIKEGIISFNKNTLSCIKNNYKECIGLFIENNLSKESEIKYVLNNNELIEVLDSEINIESKKRAVDIISSEISIIDRLLQDELDAYIINSNKDKQSEFTEVLSKFDYFGKNTQKAIVSKIISSPRVIIDDWEKSSITLRKSLLINNSMSNRLLILTSLLTQLKADEIKNFLLIIGEKDLLNIFIRKQTTHVAKVNGIYNFLDKMKELNYIISYKDDGQKIIIKIK